MLVRKLPAMQATPASKSQLNATTVLLNIIILSAIMLLVFLAILHKEITKRNSARGTVKLEESEGRIVELEPDHIAIQARLMARNRSSIPTLLRKVEYSLYADGNLMGRSFQAAEMSIPPGPTITIARTLDLSLKGRHPKVDLMAACRSSCRVVGSFQVETAYGLTTVPFDFEATGGRA